MTLKEKEKKKKKKKTTKTSDIYLLTHIHIRGFGEKSLQKFILHIVSIWVSTSLLISLSKPQTINQSVHIN